MHKFLVPILCFLCPLLALAEDEFRPVLGDRQLEYPRDHGAHPEFSTEWWYVTGHLLSSEKKTFGFELVFFRVGLRKESNSASAWNSNSIYLSHFAVTDDSNQSFSHFGRRQRGAFRQAGASEEKLEVWNGKWRLEEREGQIFLAADARGYLLELALRSQKPLVLHGENGFSKKGPERGNASYYSSFTRLTGEGSLRINGTQHKIESASAWLDQEFTSSSLARGDQGWDWFALQFRDGTELMVYQLRDKSGVPTAFSSGTFVDSSGKTTHLEHSAFSIEVLDYWTSERSKVRYPAKWRIKVPTKQISVEVVPTVQEQELQTEDSTGITYWEGRCVLREEGSEQQVGDAYVELVGYNSARQP